MILFKYQTNFSYGNKSNKQEMGEIEIYYQTTTKGPVKFRTT